MSFPKSRWFYKSEGVIFITGLLSLLGSRENRFQMQLWNGELFVFSAVTKHILQLFFSMLKFLKKISILYIALSLLTVIPWSSKIAKYSDNEIAPLPSLSTYKNCFSITSTFLKGKTKVYCKNYIKTIITTIGVWPRVCIRELNLDLYDNSVAQCIV